MDKCGVDKTKKVKIRIPQDEKGNFDLTAQRQIAEEQKKSEKLSQK
jgi:hypothetical protein